MRRPRPPSSRRLSSVSSAGSGGGTGAGSFGPSFISSRTAAITSSRESRLRRYVRGSLLLPGGGGGSGFSASSSGVRLSLFTASSFAPAATSARMIGDLPRRDGLMQQRRAVGILGVRIRAGGEQHLHRFERLAVRRFAERRRSETLEAGAGGERRAAPAVERHHHRRLADVGVHAAPAAAVAPSFFTSAGLHSTLAPLAIISFSASTSAATAAR